VFYACQWQWICFCIFFSCVLLITSLVHVFFQIALETILSPIHIGSFISQLHVCTYNKFSMTSFWFSIATIAIISYYNNRSLTNRYKCMLRLLSLPKIFVDPYRRRKCLLFAIFPMASALVQKLAYQLLNKCILAYTCIDEQINENLSYKTWMLVCNRLKKT
jgi:hypothetical protein